VSDITGVTGLRIGPYPMPGSGTRVSVIGPLEIKPGTRYNARYGVDHAAPAVRAGAGHTHSGPEAFYIVSGAQCVEARIRRR
jgi:hypothetical protein